MSAVAALALAAGSLLLGCGAPPAVDATDAAEPLGNPWAELYAGELSYARNPWDLVAFDGRLYVGGGNSSNGGPASNAGPVPVIAWEPAEGAFVQEYEVQDEQIDRLAVLDGQLTIPGHDPLGDWGAGTFYRLEAGGWAAYDNIPDAIHTYDMISHGGRLVAGLGATAGAKAAVSDDGGGSWTAIQATGFRIHALLPVGGALYTVDLFDDELEWVLPVHELAGDELIAREDLDAAALLPGAPDGEGAQRIDRAVTFGDAAVWLGGRAHNDHQILPDGVYAATSLAAGAADVQAISPGGGAPWDLAVDGDTLYALTSDEIDGGWRIALHAAESLGDWREVLYLEAPAFGRAFAWMDGDLYIGLGSEIADVDDWSDAEIAPETGEIWKIPAGTLAL